MHRFLPLFSNLGIFASRLALKQLTSSIFDARYLAAFWRNCSSVLGAMLFYTVPFFQLQRVLYRSNYVHRTTKNSTFNFSWKEININSELRGIMRSKAGGVSSLKSFFRAKILNYVKLFYCQRHNMINHASHIIVLGVKGYTYCIFYSKVGLFSS